VIVELCVLVSSEVYDVRVNAIWALMVIILYNSKYTSIQNRIFD